MFGTTTSMNIVGSYLKRSASEKVLEIFSINCEHDNSALVQNLTPPMRFNIYVWDFQQVGCSF